METKTTMNESKWELVQTVHTRMILAHLRKLEVGETVTYDELSNAVGFDVLSYRGSMDTARKRLLTDNRMVICCVRGVGLRRADDVASIEVVEQGIEKIHRQARRTNKVVNTIDIHKLESSQRSRVLAQAAITGVLEHATSSRTMKKVTAAVPSNGQLQIGTVLQVLK